MSDFEYSEGMIRFMPAPEHAVRGISPIAVEKRENGGWTRLGYDGGSRILTLAEWQEFPFPPPKPLA